MRHAVVIEAVRTPVGRAHPEKGMFRDVRAGLYHPFDTDETLEFLGKSAFGLPLIDGVSDNQNLHPSPPLVNEGRESPVSLLSFMRGGLG